MYSLGHVITKRHLSHVLGHEFVPQNFEDDRLTSLPVDRCAPVATAFTGCHVDSNQLGGMSSNELPDCTEHITQSNAKSHGVTVTACLTPDLHIHAHRRLHLHRPSVSPIS